MRLLACILVLLTTTSTAQAYDRAKLLDAFFSVVMVRGYNPDGSLAYGSGVVVAPNTVATNCHIFRKTDRPWISRGEDTYTIVSVQADRYHDMCLLKTDNLPFTPAKIGSAASLKRGQELVAIGHSSGVPQPLTSVGDLKSTYPFEGGNIIRTNARFAMGASGSGLFDAEGNLIGINTFKSPGRQAYFYALPIEWLHNVQQRPVETKFPIDAKTFWEEDDDKKPYFMQMTLPELNADWPKLKSVANNWLLAEPNSADAWYELGFAEENLKQLSNAETAYRKAIAIDKQHTDALYNLGLLVAKKGDAQQAQQIKLTLTELDPEMAKLYEDALQQKLQN